MLDGYSGLPPVSDTPVATVTRAVVEAARAHADRYGERAALIDPGQELGFFRVATVIPAAAAGLRRFGVRPGDAAAIHLPGVCDLALAVHTVAEAGAVPMPLPADADVGTLARLMTETGARVLLTGGERSSEALAAAERSYVRQVFAFGDVPGATPFTRLVETGTPGGGRALDLVPRPAPAPGPPSGADPLRDLALLVCDPPEEITHAERFADLYRLGGAAGIGDGDVLVCCARDCSAPTWIGLIDLCLTQGATFVAVPDPGVPALLAAVGEHRATAMVVSAAELRDLAYDHEAVPVPVVRLLVTGTPDPRAVRACRARHGWTVSPLE